MNPDKIKKLLGSTIYKRALDYYDEGAVLEVDFEGSEVWALVEGSAFEPYEVYVNQSRGIYDCDCPYDSLCKHIGAVLLTLFFDYPRNQNTAYPVKSKLERLNEIRTNLNNPQTRVIHLEKTISEPMEGLFSAGKLKAFTSSQRYRLVFCIYERPVGNSSYELIITPAVQYIKKDGTGGRVELYSNSWLTEEPSSPEYNLLDSLRDFPNSDAPLSIIAPFIESADNMNFLFERRGRFTDVKFRPFEALRISFVLAGFKGDDVLFRPVIKVNPGDESGETLSAEDLFVDFFNIFAAAESSVYYSFNNINLARFVRKYFSNREYFSFSEIKQLQKEAGENLSDNVIFSFAVERVKLKSATPDPVIEIDRQSNSLDITLLFRYSGRTVPYMSDMSVENLLILMDESTENEIVVASRDQSCEKLIAEVFEERFENREPQFSEVYNPGRLSFDMYTSHYCYSGGFFPFLQEHASELIEAGFEIRLKGDDTPVRPSSVRLSSEITSGIDWFEVNTRLTGENGESESFEIDPCLLDFGLVKASGGYTLLKKEDIDYLMRLSQEGIESDGSMKINKLDFDLVDSIYRKATGDVPDEVMRIHELYDKLKNFKKIKSYPVPRKLGTKLRKYQKAGYNWLHFLRQYDLNGCLADDMGLGKTVQALALLQKLKEEKELKTSLIVVPVTTLPNWENEINRFTKGLTYTIHMGQGRLKDEEALMKYDLVLTSYHTLRNDIELFAGMSFYYLILDESHYIKNSTSQAFRAVRSLKASHRLGLSGTPIENNTMELWSQMDYLNPGLLGSRKEFSRRFSKPIEKYNNADAVEKLKKLVYPFILRRKKEEVATDLPEKEEIILYCEMEAKQRKLYEGLKKVIRDEITQTMDRKGKDSSSIEIFAALMRLRQMALFPSLVSEDYSKIESGKFEIFKDLIDEILAEDHKVLVFSQFVSVLKFLESHMKKSGYGYSYIDGSTKKRAKEISRFQDDEDCRIFLLSIKAGGVGINLTSADYVVIFDPWWNPAVESQAIDRAYRIGQTRKVIAYKIITRNSIEEKMIELQNRKKKLVNDIITEDSSFFKNMSRDDIIGLFE